MLLGLKYFLHFACTSGALTAAERDRFFTEAGDALTEAAVDQARDSAARSPEVRFVELVTALLESGRCYFQGESGNVPTAAHRWGWRAVPTALRTRPINLRLHRVGRRRRYLPDVGHRLRRGAKLAEHQGDPIPLSETQLRKRLDGAGLLASKEAGKLTQRRILNGTPRTCHFRVQSLYPPPTNCWSGDGEPGDAWEPDEDELPQAAHV